MCQYGGEVRSTCERLCAGRDGSRDNRTDNDWDGINHLVSTREEVQCVSVRPNSDSAKDELDPDFVNVCAFLLGLEERWSV